MTMTIAGRDQWPPHSFVGRLPDAERAALLAVGTPVSFASDEALLVQGDVGDFLYVLLSGLVKVIVTAESGAEATLAVRSRGDLLGEFGLLDEQPRIATAKAAGEVAALRIGAAAFLAMRGESPVVQTAVTSYLLAKLRATTERRVAERVWDAGQRLAQVLYYLAEVLTEPGPEGELRVPITQGELGELAGVAVSTTERILKDFRKQGVIVTRYREIIIKDVAYLGRMRFS